MVPTAKRKMQSYIQRHDTPIAINPHGPTSPPLQHATETVVSPLTSRPQKKVALESMKLPLPPSKTAQHGVATPLDSVFPPITAPTSQPMRRTRTNSDDGKGRFQGRLGQTPPGTVPRSNDGHHERGRTWDGADHDASKHSVNLRERWENQSTMGSLFSESEVPSAHPVPAKRSKKPDLDLKARSMQSRPLYPKSGYQRPGDIAALVLNKDDQLELVGGEPLGYGSPGLLSRPSRRPQGHPTTTARDDPFFLSSEEDAGPRKNRPPLRNKFPLRSGDDAKRPPHAERAAYPLSSAPISPSPDRYDSAADAAVSQRKLKQGRDIDRKRSTVFHDVDERVTDSDIASDVPSQGDELELQRTPKAAPPQAALPVQAQRLIAQHKPPEPASPQRALQESAFPDRATSQIVQSRKRRHSMDYDDNLLSQMSYSNLVAEPFDHDPARAAIQSPAKPPADNLQDRMQFFRGKDENTQHHFFTQMSVREWEDCGDWFLEQFGSIVRKMKEARQAKRRLVEQHESEISSREEAVRMKKESLDRRLSKLKENCDTMLKGQDVDD